MSAIGTSEYMKIRRYVMNLILHAGKDPVQIPTINELSEKFGVSRATVSKAMKELTSEGSSSAGAKSARSPIPPKYPRHRSDGNCR